VARLVSCKLITNRFIHAVFTVAAFWAREASVIPRYIVKGSSLPRKSPCSRRLILKAGTSSMYVSGQFEINSLYRKEPSHEYGKERSAVEDFKTDSLTGAIHVSPDRSYASRLKRYLSGR
jgi:hypothetical protein